MGFAMPKPTASDTDRTADQAPGGGGAAGGGAMGMGGVGNGVGAQRAIPLPVDWRDVSERLRRYALALSRRHDEADDLVQQTLATLLAKAPDKAGHIGYARTTLTRVYLDRERSLRRRVARTLRLARSTHDIDNAGNGGAEGSPVLHAAIEALPPRQRAALVLRLVEELDYAQIGAALECSPEAVRSSLHMARAAVRRALGDGARMNVDDDDDQPHARGRRSTP